MISPKDLCVALIKCDSEDSVENTLKKNNYWNSEFWVPYGKDDVENSSGTFNNQQNSSDLALVEKIVNSIDAILMNKCYQNDIDPESKSAPKNMKEAILKFFNVYDGKYSNISADERKKISQNVQLIATGSKLKPCLAVFDRGEGQTPQSLPKTILSLHKGRKKKIPFVQGKYNMGGTGAITFCGEQNFQFILTKRDPNLKNDKNDETFNQWGFTIVRKRIDIQGLEVFEYLCPNGKILAFKDDNLPLLPSEEDIKNWKNNIKSKRKINPYKETVSNGTYIKLYDYKLQKPFGTSIESQLLYRLEVLLPTLGVPIKLIETRYNGIDAPVATAQGMRERLYNTINRDMENGYPKSSIIKVKGEPIRVMRYVFREGQGERWTKKSGKTGILFVINGQTHYIQPKRYFSKKEFGLDYIKDSLLVIVDCSKAPYTENRCFMASRDRLKETSETKKLFEEINNDIKEDKDLKRISLERRAKKANENIEESIQTKESLSQIINSDPTLLNFVKGMDIPNIFNLDTLEKIKKDYKGAKFASVWHLIKDTNSKIDNPKDWFQNKNIRIQYKTDVENDYFSRADEKGEFELKYRVYPDENFEEYKFDYRVNLRNSIATLNLNGVPTNLEFGTIIEFKSQLYDKNRVNPFEDNFFVKICGKQIKPKTENSPKRTRKEDKGDDSDDLQKTTASVQIPNFIAVKKEDWKDYDDMNEEDALVIKRASDDGIFDYYINMDNKYFLNHKSTEINKGTLPELVDKAFKDTVGLIGFLIVNQYDNENDDDEMLETQDYVRKSLKYIAPGIIPLIVNLNLE